MNEAALNEQAAPSWPVGTARLPRTFGVERDRSGQAPGREPQAALRSRKQLSEIVNGRAGISAEMAIRLDKAFGGGVETWHRLQAAYDFAQALKRAGKIAVRRIARAA